MKKQGLDTFLQIFLGIPQKNIWRKMKTINPHIIYRSQRVCLIFSSKAFFLLHDFPRSQRVKTNKKSLCILIKIHKWGLKIQNKT